MKISVNAGELATALALAASLSGDKVHRFLDVVRLSAAGDTLTITADVFDFMLTLTVPASVATAGEMAVLASRLAALAAGFDTEVLIEISSAEKLPISAAVGRAFGSPPFRCKDCRRRSP